MAAFACAWASRTAACSLVLSSATSCPRPSSPNDVPVRQPRRPATWRGGWRPSPAPGRAAPRPALWCCPQLLPALGRAVLTTCQFGSLVDQRLGVADGGLRLRLGEPHRGLLSGAVLSYFLPSAEQS